MTRLEPRSDDRYLILAPHPDDETLAAGGLIQGAVKAGARVTILYLTSGENNLISAILYYRRPLLRKSDFEGLGQVRRKEALSASGILGLKEDDLHFLRYPDLGMFPMRNTPQGRRVVSDLGDILRQTEPTHIIFPDARDGHADHRAVSFYLMETFREAHFLREAVSLLRYRVHRGFGAKPLESGEAVYALNGQETETKRQAILCYHSQTAYRRRFLLSFARPAEQFSLAHLQIQKDLILQSRTSIINHY